MKRKFLSIFLTLAMALTLLPTAAMAEGPDPVAQIGEKTYATLKAAFEEAKDGDTVTLLKDVETNNSEDNEAARIIINKEITLNLNDKTIRTPNGMGDNNTNFCALIIDADVTINATAEGGINTGTNGGYAINVHNGAKLTINGGTYYGGGTAVQVQKGTLIINDGHFSCEPYGEPYGYKYLINCIDKAWKDGTAKISIKGGTFVKFDPSDSASENPNGNFLAEGYGVKQDGDNYIVTEPVAAIGDTKYPTLAAAITAEAGGTVTLLKDVTGMAVIPSGKTVTIDLSGHTITRTVTSGENNKIYPALYVNGGTLTLDDTSEGKTGRVLSEITDTTVSGAMSNAVYVNGGAFTLKNGALAATAAAAPANNTWDTAYGVYVNKSTFTMENGSVTVTAPDGGAYGIAILGPNGVFTMNDGAVTADGFAISGNGSSGVGDTKITINKGTVTGGTLAIYHPQSGELKINGGTLTGKGGIETKAGDTTVSIDGNPTIVATGTPSHSINNNGNSSEGYAISVVENKNYAGGANVSIASGYYKGEVRILVDNEVAADKKGSIIITGGLFSSEPAEKYIAENHYVDASNNGDYPYIVKEGTKTDAPVIVKDTTAVTVPDSEAIKGLTNDDKTNIANKSSVDGVAEAIADNKADLIPADVNTTNAKKVEIEVTVKVNVTSADMTSENKTLTFEASPVATVTVTKADGSTEVKNDVKVPNSLLNDEITVKLPLPAGFTPKQIKHISSDGSVEYFLKTAKRGAKTFEIKDDCAVFTITKFSTFELSGTVTYVEPSSGSGSSSSSRRYDVSAPSVKHGDVTVSPKTASKGDTVTITVKPDSGYVLETLTVTDKNGNELTLKDKGNGKYTFTMPAGKVEVKATFMEDNSMLNFFYDVPNNAYFYEAVKWAVKNGITDGVGNNLFAPEQPCTRAQIVTFLWRAAGSPEPKGTAAGMTDVVPGSYYAKAVAWAVENGITTGTAEGNFSPDATCTRAQAVTFLARAQNAKATGKTAFSDVPADSYFADAVAWAQANGVTTGTSETTFSPDNDCTRAQIVTFLYRANQGT